jgi:hypothetical protein
LNAARLRVLPGGNECNGSGPEQKTGPGPGGRAVYGPRRDQNSARLIPTDPPLAPLGKPLPSVKADQS